LLKARLLGLFSAAALLAACSGGGGGSSIPAGNNAPLAPDNEYRTVSSFSAVGSTGELVRIYPTADAFSTIPAGERTAQATSPLVYHNGPVQTAPKLYVVFWGSAWNGSTGDPNGVGARLKAFYSVIGGSKWLNSVTQYTQSGGAHVGNAGNIFAGSYVDTTSAPPSRPTQSQLAAEATKAATHFGDHTASASYVVALPHGIKPSGFGTQYCAWHSSTSTSGGTIAYTNLPYMPDAGASCGSGSVNSGGTLDGVTIVGGHEQGETETDPQPNSGWLDSSGAENGDKCAWTGLENNPNAGGYPTQPLWSNANNGCVQSY
jgi:serine protease